MKKNFVLFMLVVLAVIIAACATPPTAVPPTPVPATKAPVSSSAASSSAPASSVASSSAAPTSAPASSAASSAPASSAASSAASKPSLRTKANPGEKITLYHFGDITGPYAGITTPLVGGFTDGVKWVNAKGGIRGAEIAVEWADTGGKLETAISTYNRFREKKPLLLQLYGSTETEALKDRLAEDKIPVMTAGVSSKGSYPAGYVFAVVPIYTDQFGLFLDWLVPNWDKVKPAKGQANDSPKIAIVTWDSAYGRALETPEVKAYAEKKGVKIVTQELFVTGAPDVTTQILAAKKAGANVIYTNTLAHGPAQILKDAVSLGVRDEFLIAGDNWALDTSMLALAGPASEGFYGVLPNAWWDDADHAGIKTIQAEFTANQRKPAEHSVGYLLAFTFVDAMKQYIEKTIDRVGFEGLTGQAVYETMQATTELKPMEGIQTFDFGKDKRAPTKARMVLVKGGKFTYVTDWMTAPDLRPK